LHYVSFRERTAKELRELLKISKSFLIANLEVLLRVGLLEFRG